MVKQFTCRKVAVFSDIHSNYYAFKACYEDAVKKDVEMFVFLGDYISDLADPQRTLDLVYEIKDKYPTVCLKGNRERYMLDCRNGITSFSKGSKTGSLLYTFNQLRPEDFSFLESLPIYDEIELNGIPFEIAHGSPDDDRFYFDGSDDTADSLIERMKYRYFLGGHSHKQFIYSSSEKIVCNPGSVGVARDYVCSTQYAMMEIKGQNVRFELCRLSYDIPAMIQRQFESGLTEIASYWATGVLYDVLTGEIYAMELLKRLEGADVQDETAWRKHATDMGIRFTEEEILAFSKELQRR